MRLQLCDVCGCALADCVGHGRLTMVLGEDGLVTVRLEGPPERGYRIPRPAGCEERGPGWKPRGRFVDFDDLRPGGEIDGASR